MNRSLPIILVVVVAISPVILLLAMWQSIPETFVLSFEINRQFEDIQTKNELLVGVIILAVVSILGYLLLSRLHRIDPKVKLETPRSVFNKFGLIVCLFLTALSYYLVLTARNQWASSVSVLIGFMGLLVTLLGNYMNSIKPNYFVGIRLPWTLNDPDNWRRTHQFASKIWFVSGLLIICFGFLLSKPLLMPVFIATMIIIVIVPGIYSFQLYRKAKS